VSSFNQRGRKKGRKKEEEEEPVIIEPKLSLRKGV
jgi:hypothetical protein